MLELPGGFLSQPHIRAPGWEISSSGRLRLIVQYGIQKPFMTLLRHGDEGIGLPVVQYRCRATQGQGIRQRSGETGQAQTRLNLAGQFIT